MSCISDDCVDNMYRRPLRPVSYASLRKFGTPEFVRSANSSGGVVNSSSCRQKFLRSYTFTREDSPPPPPAVVARDKPSRMWFGQVRERLIERKKSRSRSRESVDINGDEEQDQYQEDYNHDFSYKRSSAYRVRMGKEVSCAAFLGWCKRTMLFCTIKVDVADRV